MKNTKSNKLISLILTSVGAFIIICLVCLVVLNCKPNANEQSKSNAISTENSSTKMISASLRKTLKKYENFIDDYVAFMKKYNSSSNPSDLMTEYEDIHSDYNDWEEKINNIDQVNLSAKDLAYYNKVTTRVYDKIASLFDDSSSSNSSNKSSQKSSKVKSDKVSADFKETMDEYEEFIDEYVAFMKKYNKSDDTYGMLTDYSNMSSDYEDWVEKIDEIDEDSLSATDLAYYNEVTARVAKKLVGII